LDERQEPFTVIVLGQWVCVPLMVPPVVVLYASSWVRKSPYVGGKMVFFAVLVPFALL